MRRKMNKLFVALTVAALTTILVSVNTHARHQAFDGKGNLFVADYSGTISKYTPDGTKSTFTYGLMPEGVYDVVFDRAGNLFVSDRGSKSILKFTPDGKKSTFASGVTPVELIFDHSVHLIVLVGGVVAFLKFTPVGTKSTFATGDFIRPIFDKAGNLYVLESGSILKFTPDGVRSTFAVVSEHTSPDKKWEYVGGDEQKLVKSGTNEMALDLSDHVLG